MKKILIPAFFILFTNTTLYATCSISKPKGLNVVSITSCSAVVGWGSVSNASYYLFQYKKSTATSWTQVNVGSATTYTVTGMKVSTLYYFKVAAICSDGTSSGYTDSIQKKTQACTTPQSLKVSGISAHEATISWQEPCSCDNYSLKYKPNSSSKWITISTINQPSEIMTGLVAKTGYQVKVASVCDTVTTAYTDAISFTTLDSSTAAVHKPNVLIFVLDDARYDQFIPNGGPSWFQTPYINSIATQGVNFQLCIPAESQCAPSRISIYTGLYPHHHGSVNNLTHYNSSVPLIQQILKDYGYYTGFVGKYGQNQGNPIGFNYWAISTNDNYNNPPYVINGRDTSIQGHITDVYFQLAKTFLTSVPKKQPFMLMYFTRVPHAPAIPRTQDSNLYKTDTMPFPSNFFSYNQNYPSYYYAADHIWTDDSAQTVQYKLKQFETLYGAECNMDSFITYLTHKGILDSTIIMVSSDNGFLQGEHMMTEKEVPLEESLKVPLFVRYPTWFKAGKIINNNIVSNIDIAPTLLELAGISGTYNMDGVSLHKLYKGTAVRNSFYYEFGKQNPVPAIRAVRALNYTYSYDYCNSTTEEFYDRIKDPLEDTNRINTQSYQPLIQYYQTLLDSLKSATGDSLFPKDLTCNLQNAKTSRDADKDVSSDVLLHLSPNPISDGKLEVSFYDPNAKAERISVMDDLGRMLWSKNYNEQTDYIYEMLDAAAWKQGIYFLSVEEKNHRYTRSFIVQ